MITFLFNVPGHTDDDTVNDVVLNLFIIVTIEKADAVNIVGGAILINDNIETVSADIARVIVESVDGCDIPQITLVHVDVVQGHINFAQTERCK